MGVQTGGFTGVPDAARARRPSGPPLPLGAGVREPGEPDDDVAAAALDAARGEWAPVATDRRRRPGGLRRAELGARARGTPDGAARPGGAGKPDAAPQRAQAAVPDGPLDQRAAAAGLRPRLSLAAVRDPGRGRGGCRP